MAEVRQTQEFSGWLRRLKDAGAVARIVGRIRRMELGSPGDAKSVGRGVMEMRIAYGPGYRIYYVQRAAEIVILLCGGDKRTHRRDIKRAQALAEKQLPKTTRFDAADYLDSEERAGRLHHGGAGIGDADFVRDALGVVAKARGMGEIAKIAGLNRESLYKALGETGNPEFGTVMRIVRALGLTLAARPAATARTRKKRRAA